MKILNSLKFIELIKPKIIIGNLVTMLGAYSLASKGILDFKLLILTTVAITLIMSSACILNNVIDRDIDKQMYRTNKRMLVTQFVSIKLILYFSYILFFWGIFIFYYYINLLSMYLALLAFFIYVMLYSLYLKRNSIYSIFVGSLSGAIVPVIGYCSVINSFNFCAFFLLLMFICWQIPHSLAIAIIYNHDYKKVNIPTIPILYGLLVTKYQIIFYIICFIFFSGMLSVLGYAGETYLLVTLFFGSFWLFLGLKGLYITNNICWARTLFYFSIILIFIISFTMCLDFNSIIQN
ncbi:heme o synthase [Buchnera aphidicola (Formosaphis micheliae)]|uniref:heme o synthase n=1 Tax=Buchnera aphidicola TaxID=9 RepID=UPI0031CC4287